jgi:cytidyltransferase-like protein
MEQEDSKSNSESKNQEGNSEKIIVVASGYFDPIHVGHIECLKLAKELGDHLIVIVNNNEQAILKNGKYVMHHDERMNIVQELKCVDEVFLSIDKDRSICKSLAHIKPHIFAKGGDRTADEIPEGPTCKEHSIKIIDGLGAKIQHSSELRKRMNH